MPPQATLQAQIQCQGDVGIVHHPKRAFPANFGVGHRLQSAGQTSALLCRALKVRRGHGSLKVERPMIFAGVFRKMMLLNVRLAVRHGFGNCLVELLLGPLMGYWQSLVIMNDVRPRGGLASPGLLRREASNSFAMRSRSSKVFAMARKRMLIDGRVV